MPNCPICGEWMLDEEKLEAHIREQHPEETESMSEIMSRFAVQQSTPMVAVELLGLSLKYKKSPEEVHNLFVQMIELLTGD